MTKKSKPRLFTRYKASATFEIPTGKTAYERFRNLLEQKMWEVDKELGDDCELQHLEIDQTARDTVV